MTAEVSVSKAILESTLLFRTSTLSAEVKPSLLLWSKANCSQHEPKTAFKYRILYNINQYLKLELN